MPLNKELLLAILDELERIAKLHGMVSEAHELRHAIQEPHVHADNTEEEQHQLVR